MTTAVVAFNRLLPLLSIVHLERMLINELNDHFNIDHNLFLFDASVDTNRFINMEGQVDTTPKSLYIFEDINGNITGLKFLNKTISNNELLIVAPSSSFSSTNLSLLMQVKEIRRLRLKIKIGFFFSHIIPGDDLQRVFEWCWKNRIINIFATMYAHNSSNSLRVLNSFTYNPFGKFKVINVTDTSFDHFFLSQASNFRLHELQIGEDRKNAKISDLWLIIFRVLNCSYKFMEHQVDMRDRQGTLDKNPTIDIFTNTYTTKSSEIVSIYPVYMSQYSILVPEALPYSEFTSYLQNILSSKFYVLSSIIIAATILLLCVIRFKKEKKMQFYGCVTDVLNLLMNDNSSVKYQKLNQLEGFIIVPLTFVGLVLVNGILSTLQSHIAKPYLQHQINSAEDIYR